MQGLQSLGQVLTKASEDSELDTRDKEGNHISGRTWASLTGPHVRVKKQSGQLKAGSQHGAGGLL